MYLLEYRIPNCTIEDLLPPYHQASHHTVEMFTNRCWNLRRVFPEAWMPRRPTLVYRFRMLNVGRNSPESVNFPPKTWFTRVRVSGLALWRGQRARIFPRSSWYMYSTYWYYSVKSASFHRERVQVNCASFRPWGYLRNFTNNIPNEFVPSSVTKTSSLCARFPSLAPLTLKSGNIQSCRN